MVNFETFKSILKQEQAQLKTNLKNCIKKLGYQPVEGDGFLYAKGDIPILLVAHMDTVHKQKPINIYYDSEQKIMWSPQGIGGDDRCGVYIILKLLESFKPHVLFTEDEEIGCVGARKVVETIVKPDVKFIIEIDRRGKDDCVFYDCGNKDFQEYIESFDFTMKYGSFSDIVYLSEKWDIASVNLSAGYYNEHTTNEIINISDMQDTFDRVVEILDDDKSNKTYFDYQKVKYVPRNNTYKNWNNKDKSKDYAYEDQYGYIDDDGQFHWWDDEYNKE